MNSDQATAQRTRRRRTARWVLASVAAVVLVVGVAAGAYVWSVLRTIDQNLTQEHEAFPDETSRPAAPEEDEEGRTPVNVLLLGSDKRSGEAAESIPGQRSDVFMLAHLSADRRSVDLISFPRDSWVEVPGYGMAKINSAMARGGFSLAVQTAEELLGVRIDHVASIDMEGFREMTTALGGVTVTVEQPFTGHDTDYPFTRGEHRVEGDVALDFVRERKALEQGDLDRVSNQQQVLEGILAEALDRDTLTNPGQLSDFVDSTTRYMTVSSELDSGRIRELALQGRHLRADDIHMMTAPVAGLGRSADGQSIVRLDQERLEELAEALRQDDMAAYRSGS